MSELPPLAGLRVLDFSRVLAGPQATALLADLGAEIIKIEAPQGDDYRHIGPFLPDGSSALFEAVNRGKRSLVLDLAQATDREIAQTLARDADIVVENFRPGVADKLGIGWDSLSALNPRLIYASISGFGQSGPDASRPAYDIVVQAMSGLMSVTGRPDGEPTLIGESIADVVSGLFASWAILAAMVERQRTGQGRRIDVAMFDAMMALQPLVLARYLATGTPPQRVGNRHPLSAPFGAFQAQGGQFVLAVLNNKLFAALAQVIDQPDLASDPDLLSDSGRLAQEPRIRAAIETWAASLTPAQAVAALIAAGVPAADVMDTPAALSFANQRGRPVTQTVPHPTLGQITLPEQPAHFAGVVRGTTPAAPRLGDANTAIHPNPALAWTPRP